MLRSNRGAARVSAIWLISVGVLFLAALAFGFIAQSDLSKERNAAQAAEVAKKDADTLFEEANEAKRNISEVLGWYDRASADPESNVENAQQALDELKATFPDLDATVQDFESALPIIRASVDAHKRKIAELESRVAGLQDELASAQSAVATVTSEKDTRIQELESSITDEQNNASDRETELNSRLSTAQEQVSERDAELRRVRAELVDLQRAFDEERRVFETRISSLMDLTAFAREPFSQNPDATVIEVSTGLGIGWIDIGANNRLARGMRFKVTADKPNAEVKAEAEVTRVEANRAEVVFTNVGDTVAKGDVLINPLYDPDGDRNAVLAGSFSGSYNKKDLTALLGRIGVNVQKELQPTTHFLIVGGDLWTDPETSEPLEEPLSPSELAVYKNAEAQGVQIIPIQDVRQFFRIATAGQ